MVLIAAIFLLNLHLTKRLERYLRKELIHRTAEATDGFYRLSFDNLSISFFKGELTLEGIKLCPDSAVFRDWERKDSQPSVYVTGEVSYEIPFGEKKVCYSPKIFSGESHLVTARKAREWEYESYRNLAVNVMDQHGDTNCYPHATANVETRGESVFAARNAIDGVTSNHSHGYWPYGSWGINRNPQATMRVDFGREVTTDRIEIYTRADFPHDAWWTKATVRFSDDTTMVCDLVKTDEGQEFTFPPKKVRWVQLEELIKADDPSPFPALSQLKVYGK